MELTFIIHYIGKNGNALKFAKEMTEIGIVGRIRSKEGNLQYQYYESFDDKETIILIDSWKKSGSTWFTSWFNRNGRNS